MKKLLLIAPLCLIGLAGCDNMAGPSYSSTPAVQQAETGVIVGVRTVQVAGANSTAGGAIAGGLLGSAFGLRTALVISLLTMISPALWLFFSPVYRLREIPAGPDTATTSAEGTERTDG